MIEDATGEQRPQREPAEAENISDKAGVEKRNRRIAERTYQGEQVVRRLMSDREGRAWMYDLLSRCHMYATSYIPGDPGGMAFQEGERNVGLRVLDQIPADLYAAMISEAKG